MKTNRKIEQELIDIGFDVNVHRFPYTYHHDYLRNGESRAEIAIKLWDVCKDHNKYDYTCCHAAILQLVECQPEKISYELCELLEYVEERSLYGRVGKIEMREKLFGKE